MLRSQFFGLAILLLSSLLYTSCTTTNSFDKNVEEQAIRSLLDTQVQDWNAADIDAFMQGYWASDSLRFASGNAFRQGWQETLERYKASYPDKAAMGQLNFELYEVNVLSHDAATVFGRFHLKREESLGDLTGLFTLIFRKQGEKWLIVHDHTSS